MPLIDSPIWIDHFSNADVAVQRALDDDDDALMHPFVLGELALGRPRDRAGVFVQQPREVMAMIERLDLAGRGIGYVDAHLLVWTRDTRLAAAARHLGVGETLR